MHILFTVDVEAHRVIDEISGQDHDSLGDILLALREASCRATFFVDLIESHTWGGAVLRRACDRILEDGHELALHVHPHHHPIGDSNRWLLHEYSCEDQRRIIWDGVSQYAKWFGVIPKAFRAGGFGADACTIRTLQAAGVAIDSSVLWGRRSCGLSTISDQGPFHFEGVREFPLTHLIVFGHTRWPVRISALDFNWLPLFVLKWALKRMAAERLPVAVILLHSSSMYVRIGRKRLLYVPTFRKKLRRLLQYATHVGEVRTISAADAAIAEDSEPSLGVSVRIPYLWQYLVLFFQSVIGCGISVRFRLFLLGHVLGICVLLALWALTS
jgi:peptidoglycan/xylan/chitin deacetylase (PgdA/CDA1 family)